MKLIHLAKNELNPKRLIDNFCPSDFGYKNDCPDDNTGRAVYDCKKCWNKEGKGKNGLTPDKKEVLKNLMGSVKLPEPSNLSSADEKRDEASLLFNSHMNTMYDLVIELSKRKILTDAEEKFLDALDAWNEFCCGDEE